MKKVLENEQLDYLGQVYELERACGDENSIGYDELEARLFDIAYKGIWASYGKEKFEPMEYLALVAIRLAIKRGDMIRLFRAYNGRALASHCLGRKEDLYNQEANVIFNEIMQYKEIYTKKEIKDLVKSKIKNDFGIIISLSRKKAFDKANALANYTISLAREYELYIEEGLSYKIKGKLYFDFKKYQRSFSLLLHAASIFKRKNTKIASAKLIALYLLICENYFKLKQFEEGKQYLDYVVSENEDKLPYIFYSLSADYLYYKCKKASPLYLKATEKLDLIRSSILFESNTDSFLSYKSKADVYFKAIRSLVQEGDVQTAFFVLEKFRATMFKAAKTNVNHFEEDGGIKRVLVQEKEEKIKELEILLKKDTISYKDDKRIKELKENIYRLDEIRGYSKQKQVIQMQDIKDFMRLMPASSLVISYFYYLDYIYIFITGKKIFKIIAQKVSFDIEAIIYKYLEFMQHGCSSSFDLEEDYYKKQITKLLISPIKPYLNLAKELIIIPFKALHLFPLHYLFWEVNEDILLSYLPNLNSLLHLEKSHLSELDPILLIGDPRNNLSAAREEVNNISSLFKKHTLLIGKDAKKDKIIKVLEEYPIVHYSGHIKFDERRPLYSFLELGLSDNNKDGIDTAIAIRDDSILYLKEIQELKLDKLNFLSLGGCSSGVGKYYNGEEIVGLLRGFFYAGAKSILSTFWDVEDRSSKEFLELFFAKTIKHKGDKKLGFQKAYKKMKAKHETPYLFAAFALYEGI